MLGGGPIGCELTQAFARLGSDVTLVEMAPQLLGREDADASTAVLASLRDKDGVDVALATRAIRCEGSGNAGTLVCERDGTEVRYEFDRLLLALGRRANANSAGLQDIGVEIAKNGTVATDPFLRTNYPSISVCGDVAGPYQFTHVAAHQAWFAAVNSLLRPFWSFRTDYSVIPWCTFTSPEVARVGLNETEAKERGIEVEVTRYGIDDLDRAITDSEAHGFVKVLTAPGTDKILGATIVGAHAGELIAEFVLAMKHELGLNKLLGTIHIYPTMMEANKYVAGEWKRANKPEKLLRLRRALFRLAARPACRRREYLTVSDWMLGHEPQLRLAVFLSLFALLLVFQQLRPLRDVPGGLRRSLTNLSLVIVDTLILRVAFPVLAVGLALRLEANGGGLLHALPSWAAVVTGVVLLDLAIYWQHRLLHVVPLFWRLHRVHHADTGFDVTTAVRFHPLEIALSMAIKLGLIALLGAPALAVLIFEMLLSAGSLFTHANVRLPGTLRTPLALAIRNAGHAPNSPFSARDETDSNFGFHLSIWDRIFGSYRDQPRDGQTTMAIGLHEFRDYRDQSLWALLLNPFRATVRKVESKSA